ncbi:TPA: Apoptotic chromatin condensation inducer in the nucleus [Trebouxia sp. C0005]
MPETLVQEAPPPTLDDLFKKTITKPYLYWMPLTEEQAADRKAQAEAAAAEKAKAEELPDAPVPMIAV